MKTLTTLLAPLALFSLHAAPVTHTHSSTRHQNHSLEHSVAGTELLTHSSPLHDHGTVHWRKAGSQQHLHVLDVDHGGRTGLFLG